MKVAKSVALVLVILTIGAQIGKLFGGPGSGYGDIPFVAAMAAAWFAVRWAFRRADGPQPSDVRPGREAPARHRVPTS